jgi:hypothetical protein
MDDLTPDDLTPVERLKRDLKKASATLSEKEVRYLVDLYYAWQEDRKRANNQVRAMKEADPKEEPHEIVLWLAAQSDYLETQIKGALGVYAASKPAGQWMLAQHGIGPVISAGMLAHIDIAKAITAGHVWRYAGLDPSVVWLPKTKRPWNASLKVLCWKAGQSFMKFSNDPKCFYGKLYRERKAYELARNETDYAKDQAAAILEGKRFGKDTEAYKHLSAGHLPPAQIDGRARRYAVKIFLSNLQTVWWFSAFGSLPPAPYAIVHAGHAHRIDPPHADVIEGLAEALRRQP